MKIKLEPWAFEPIRAHKTDAGLDLRTPIDFSIAGRSSEEINTGVAVEIPEGYVGFVKSKSGLLFKHNITTDGTVDCGYTGNIMVKLINHGKKAMLFQKEDKIAQLVVLPCVIEELEFVEELEETERGENGFGSTGR